VLGVTLVAGTEAPLDRRSLLVQVGLIALAVFAFLVPSVPGFHGDPERLSLAYASIPVAIFLLCVYLAVTIQGLRRHSRLHAAEAEEAEEPTGWPLWVALTALAVATVATALVSEILVHSLDEFAKTAGLSRFFISAVIVAVVGNAAEHGGAVVVAHRGKMRLATEIAISSGAQVALLVASAVTLLSFLFPHPLPLSFRPIELAAMGGAAAAVAVAVAGGRSKRWAGVILVGLYAGVVVAFYAAGDR